MKQRTSSSISFFAVIALLSSFATSQDAKVYTDIQGNVHIDPSKGGTCFCGNIDISAMNLQLQALQTTVNALVASLSISNPPSSSNLINVVQVVNNITSLQTTTTTQNQQISGLQSTVSILNSSITTNSNSLQVQLNKLVGNINSVNLTVQTQQTSINTQASNISSLSSNLIQLNNTIQSVNTSYLNGLASANADINQVAATLNTDIVVSNTDTFYGIYGLTRGFESQAAYVYGGIDISTNPKLESISFPSMLYVSRFIYIWNNVQLMSFSAPKLTYVGEDSHFDGYSTSSLSVLVLPLLSYVGGVLGVVNFPVLTYLSLPSLTFVGGAIFNSGSLASYGVGIVICGFGKALSIPSNIPLAGNNSVNTFGCFVNATATCPSPQSYYGKCG